MTLLSLEKIVGTNGYFIDDEDLKIYSFKNPSGELDNEPHLLKPHINNNGYLRYTFRVNGKVKHILYHVIIVKTFIKPNYDSAKYDIDHMDRNKLNNSIENLAVVSRSDNNRNMSKSRTGKEFNYYNNIGDYLVINEEAKIYYSLDLDKFFMYIKHSGKYKELHICLEKGIPYIRYKYNNKGHRFSINKFKKNLNKQ